MRAIVLRKKMKPLMATLALLTACIHLCHGQKRNSIETDIASAIIYGKIRLGVEHALAEQWSVKAEASFDISVYTDLADKEEVAHWNELYGERFRDISSDGDHLTEHGVSFRFWPRGAFHGPSLSMGGSLRDRDKPDLTAGVGYDCRIWRNLNAYFMYSTRILDCIKNGLKPSEGLRLGISYVF